MTEWVITNKVSDAELGLHPEGTEGIDGEINRAVTQDKLLLTPR